MECQWMEGRKMINCSWGVYLGAVVAGRGVAGEGDGVGEGLVEALEDR